MANRIKTTKAVNPKQILYAIEPQVSIGCIVGNAGVTADTSGKKIIKAGTPVGGATSALETRDTVLSVTNATESGKNAQGVLLHDVDVTDGNANGTLLIFGFVNLDRIEPTIDAAAKTALSGKVTFLKG